MSVRSLSRSAHDLTPRVVSTLCGSWQQSVASRHSAAQSLPVGVMPAFTTVHTPTPTVEAGRQASPPAQSDETAHVSPRSPSFGAGGVTGPMPPSPPPPVSSPAVQRWLKQRRLAGQSAARVQLSPSPPSTGAGVVPPVPVLPPLPEPPVPPVALVPP